MPHSDTKARTLRKARMKSQFGLDKPRQAALRNPRNTRSKAKVLREFESGEYFIQPAAPSYLFKGTRPGWQNADDVWNKWGGRGKVACVKCGKAADSIDHRKNWTSHVLDQCDWISVRAANGYWEGLRKSDVIEAYNDFNNLQPMCTSCNSTKNGPKNIDRLKPVFVRNGG